MTVLSTPNWCPKGFEIYAQRHMRCAFSSTGQVVAWEVGSMADKLHMCLRQIDEDRIFVDKACRAKLTAFWSMSLHRIVDLTSEDSGNEFIASLNELKRQLETDFQTLLDMEARSPCESFLFLVKIAN